MLGNQYQQDLDKLIEAVPRTLIESLVEKKLGLLGEEIDPTVVKTLSREILDGKYDSDDETLSTIPRDPDQPVITITERDLKHINNKVDDLVRELPRIMEEQSDWAGERIYKSLRASWPEQEKHINQRKEAHGTTMASCWGDALNHLEMLHRIGEELAQEAVENRSHSKEKHNSVKQEVQHRLAIRACNVLQEIISLVWSGLPDGAHARWRTLHEIAVVANLIDDGDESLSKRYLAHDAVQAKRALEVYLSSYKRMGYPKPDESEKREIDEAYNSAISEFGKDFRHEYGWASNFVKNTSPKFIDLERVVDQDFRRPMYKSASAQVHAGISGITQTLGLFEDQGAQVLGRSIIGFDEIGINSSISFSQILLTLLSKPTNFDSLVTMKTIMTLSERCHQEFETAAKKVQAIFK